MPLSVSGLTKRYTQHAVFTDLALEIEAGEVVAFMGRNGAGKSTLLGCITGTVMPDAGSIRVAGLDLHREPVEARRRLRYLAQEVDAPAGVTGRELLRFFADVFDDPAGMSRAEAMADLGSALDHLASTYSVGMRRRLMFAGLVFGQAALYVLDEPFSGLDAASRIRMREYLATRAQHGAAVLLAAHDHDTADLDALGARRKAMG